MRAYSFILFSFLFILLGNSVHGSNEKMLRVRSAVERPRRRTGHQMRHQPSTISIEEMQEQFGQLGFQTAPNSSHHHGAAGIQLASRTPIQYGHTQDAASTSSIRLDTVEDMDIRMQSLGLHGEKMNRAYAMRNPNAPPPLPSDHFDKICPGSIISVMIQGKTYIDVGLLHENSTWPLWVFRDFPSEPFGSDRAWISVSDPDMLRPIRGDHRKFSAGFRIYLPHMYHGPNNENPTSQVFITNGAYVYHASLLLTEPNRDNNPSVVSVLSEIQSGVYRCLHGVLKVWGNKDHIPDWVLQRRPVWL